LISGTSMRSPTLINVQSPYKKLPMDCSLASFSQMIVIRDPAQPKPKRDCSFKFEFRISKSETNSNAHNL
jgi:hypothetical protein